MITKAAFKQLFDRYFDTIRMFIFYRCGDIDMASDMAQDVFMRLWEKREQFVDDNLRALLYKMAGDVAVSHYRKSAGHSDFEQSMRRRDDQAASPEEELLFREFTGAYARSLEEMSEAQRTVFLMSRNDNMKYHEIAECLSISVKAVEKRMSAALQYLRNNLL